MEIPGPKQVELFLFPDAGTKAGLKITYSAIKNPDVSNTAALITRTGFGGILYCNHNNMELPKIVLVVI